MSLIVMAVHDTEENGRSEFTLKTMESLLITVNWEKHRMLIIDNNSCAKTWNYYQRLSSSGMTYNWQILYQQENLGTARAINKGFQARKLNEHVIKIDNDVVIHQSRWVEQLEEAVAREPKIGMIGLKRKDLWETPWHEIPSNRCELMMLPHEAGQRWIIVEKSKHIMGTCCLHTSALLDKIGYMYQPGVYGYDDTLMTLRANLAGFITCFLSHIDIDHIDPGGTEYIEWKRRQAGIHQKEVIELMRQYTTGEKSYYHDFY